ncbi:membrane protein insertion efficiency factor YidD [Candidatus Roizmanbacteria bacterium CG_4_10_14_0_2_um_filter_36_35]|uniref:Putative membrane protein insertion efficiency factor n=3 Tax=Candidatus Roizmaniibacteriota TaxID=1752723 RepID=A0A2M7UBN3_9BACT|nr:MAG: membrane protein insertion efficiency factor YidD [Candidatus Roizmanbacteria bacterium CG11_big_fil_rev_8_21_14_0_20_35_14]PIZ68666.1 MAG: membrane protein insertion efficiency factor YidD [Candidatus Roizmanbacteria bacterium CG_4_10_14_0_2_um_filter_36_35]PJC30794.1 MAG: membrane protein insertion efficiency factor YidD [Candidatus Roizmanbacteria bacterium CG_4_9_14_0_2_um_filter_36_12]
MKRLILNSIRFYQKTKFFHGAIAKQLFLTDQVCRFNPTCSEYTYQAVKKYGVIKGIFLGLKRIIRCHPWNKGGNDPLK